MAACRCVCWCVEVILCAEAWLQSSEWTPGRARLLGVSPAPCALPFKVKRNHCASRCGFICLFLQEYELAKPHLKSVVLFENKYLRWMYQMILTDFKCDLKYDSFQLVKKTYLCYKPLIECLLDFIIIFSVLVVNWNNAKCVKLSEAE